MSNEEFFNEILENQELTNNQLENMEQLKKKVKNQLSSLDGDPKFYDGGSLAKGTIISESYDLDVVIYWPKNTKYTLQGISEGVGNHLKKYWTNVYDKTVAWVVPFEGNFHIDVVPGRAIDPNFYEANLYRMDNGKPLHTSLKKHVKFIRQKRRIEVIKLVKLWKVRRNLPFKTFILENIVIMACKTMTRDKIEPQLIQTFQFIYDNIGHISLNDPANPNNIITDGFTTGQRNAIRNEAKRAIDAKSWSEVFQRT